MAERRAMPSDLFWTLASWGFALIFGGAFAYIIGRFSGHERSSGLIIGAVIFVVAGWILSRFATAELPPPNTVKAPTVRMRTAPQRPEPAPTLSESLQSARDTVQEAWDHPGDTANRAWSSVSEAVSGAAQEVGDAVSGTAQDVSDAAADATHDVRSRIMGDAEAEPEAAEPARPTGLTGAREGTADDLKRIKGVGPKLEEVLHGLGFYHFDQIAAWTPAEVAWVDSNLEGFNGRATRDEWVEQSRILAEGGTTEFAQRVDKGDVY